MRSRSWFNLTRLTAVVLLGTAASACNSRSDTQSGDRTSDTTSDIAGGSDTLGVGTGDGVSSPDQQFLRMMSDHHTGLIMMAHDAERKGARVKSEADKIDQQQDAELDRMVSMLSTDFNDDYTPKVTPEHQAMADSLKKLSGAAYDRAFREITIKHHQQGIQMMDRFLPQLTGADLKQMVEKMKADQTREIARLKRELRQS
jgi:uncharacterized protein (DUF305 family)